MQKTRDVHKKGPEVFAKSSLQSFPESPYLEPRFPVHSHTLQYTGSLTRHFQPVPARLPRTYMSLFLHSTFMFFIIQI